MPKPFPTMSLSVNHAQIIFPYATCTADNDLKVPCRPTVDWELSRAERHEDSHFPPGVSATVSEPVTGIVTWAGRWTCRLVLVSPAGPRGWVFNCGPNSRSTWKSAWSPRRNPTPTRESVPATLLQVLISGLERSIMHNYDNLQQEWEGSPLVLIFICCWYKIIITNGIDVETHTNMCITVESEYFFTHYLCVGYDAELMKCCRNEEESSCYVLQHAPVAVSGKSTLERIHFDEVNTVLTNLSWWVGY
jgi:hypothetical protein